MRMVSYFVEGIVLGRDDTLFIYFLHFHSAGAVEHQFLREQYSYMRDTSVLVEEHQVAGLAFFQGTHFFSLRSLL